MDFFWEQWGGSQIVNKVKNHKFGGSNSLERGCSAYSLSLTLDSNTNFAKRVFSPAEMIFPFSDVNLTLYFGVLSPEKQAQITDPLSPCRAENLSSRKEKTPRTPTTVVSQSRQCTKISLVHATSQNHPGSSSTS